MHRIAATCLLAALLAACDSAPCSTDDDCFSGEICREDGQCRKAVAQDMSSPDLDMMDLGSPREDMTTRPDMPAPLDMSEMPDIQDELDMPDPDLPDPCASFMCAPGTCDPTSPAPICSCPEGYSAADPKRCAPVPTAVAAGAQHTCTIQLGRLSCWGDNTRGQLGVGDTTTRDTPTAVIGLPAGVTAVAAGELHTCAIAGGGLYCWGDHARGQLGKGSAGALMHNTPQPITLPNMPAHIAAGKQHTCAITSNGALLCWGDNRDGQLGTGGNNTQVTTPNPIAAPLTFGHVSAGDTHTCAISAGKVKCWGAGASGRLGTGSLDDQRTPADLAMAPASNITDIAAGGRHTCAITSAGELYCWGVNDQGELGTDKVPSSGTTTPKLIPAAGVTHITTGQSHTCAIQRNAISCWGLNTSGQGGQGSLGATLTTPRPVNLPISVAVPAAITAGARHTCAIASDKLYCWGDNAQRQLGTGSSDDALIPTLIALP